MKYFNTTLLRNAINVDGGGNAPSGTLSLDNKEGSDTDGDLHTEETPPEAVELDPKDKVPTTNDKKSEKPLGEIKDDKKGDEKVPEIDDLLDNELSTEEAAARKKKLEDAAKAKQEQQKAIADNKGEKKDDNTDKRDYSVFENDAEIKAIVDKYKSKIPNEVFNALKKQAESNKSLLAEKASLTTKLEDASKGIVRLPDNYLQHPEAWRFDPKVRQISGNIQLARAQSEHYAEQLQRIEVGEDWEDLVGINEDGSFKTQVVAIKDTTSKMKIDMQRIISQKDQEVQGFQGQLNQLRVNHTNAYDNIVKGIDSKLKEFCPWLRDSKLQDNKIPKINEKGEVEEVSIKQEMENSLLRIPENLRNNPLAPVVVNLQVGLAIANAKALAYESHKVVDEQIKKDKERAEPNINGKANKGGAKAANTSVPSTSDMDD